MFEPCFYSHTVQMTLVDKKEKINYCEKPVSSNKRVHSGALFWAIPLEGV